MSEEKMREEFDAWIDDVDEQRAVDGLRMLNASERRHMFAAWQASRAALVVELPDWFCPHDAGDRAYWAELIEKAIKAAGVRAE